ncbi:hypothetical protein C8J56DRAFT_891704 [Mycena floridula]|nr:hypothetical protein C8J56DRAFT_891704 [Mycena floridula]
MCQRLWENNTPELSLFSSPSFKLSFNATRVSRIKLDHCAFYTSLRLRSQNDSDSCNLLSFNIFYAKFILAAFSAFITASAAPGAGALRRHSEFGIGIWADGAISKILLLDERDIKMDLRSAESKVSRLTIWMLERQSTLFVRLSFLHISMFNMKEDGPPAHLNISCRNPMLAMGWLARVLAINPYIYSPFLNAVQALRRIGILTPRRAGSLYPAPRRIIKPRATQDLAWPAAEDRGGVFRPAMVSAFVILSQMVYPDSNPDSTSMPGFIDTLYPTLDCNFLALSTDSGEQGLYQSLQRRARRKLFIGETSLETRASRTKTGRGSSSLTEMANP